jgi:hypothetical protein
MPIAIGVNIAHQKPANDELVIWLGGNQLRTRSRHDPWASMITAAGLIPKAV